MFIKDKIDKNFLYFFDQGDCVNAYDFFGAHLVKDEEGNNIACEFALYAPNAKSIEIIGEWNGFTRNKDYLNCVRIEKAKELLLNSNEKVYKISELVGYNNVDYFINKFTKVVGTTPSKFRNLSKY